MKKILSICSVAVFSVLIFSSCSKIKNDTPDANSKQHNEDVSNTKGESDNVNSDVNNAMFKISGFAGKKEGIADYSICGATIDSSHNQDPQPYITITFDGTTVCPNPNRKRSGEIKVQLVNGTSWADANAVLKITHTNYKVIFTDLNNHFVTFNGTKYLTNESGINLVQYFLTGGTTIALKERSDDMSVTFENGQTSTWNIARRSTWVFSNYTNIVATVNGDTTVSGKTLDSWGKTRFNTNFETEMVSPWVSGTACGWWKPTSGKYISTTDNFTITATFGVNSNGNPVTSGCAYGFKLEWVLGTLSSGQAVISYWY